MTQLQSCDSNAGSESKITVGNLHVNYHGHPALKNISGTFGTASMTAIIGPNGGGKSTFLKAILQLIPSQTDAIQFHNLTRRDIAYVPQLSEIDRGFPLIVEEAIAFGFCQQFGFFKSITAQERHQIDCILNTVGLYHVKHKTLDTLSGGQFQRVLFARLSVQQSKFIILDEPFAAVDSHTIDELIQMILQWHQSGKSIIMVSHDLDLVERFFPQTILIAQHCLGWGNTAEVINKDNIDKSRKIARDLNNHAHAYSSSFSTLNVKY